MSLFTLAPPPKTSLARYRKLSRNAGVHVSPLCLGAGSIGDQWEKFGLGAMNKESSFKLLDAYYDAGGNFIDTANLYQDETSEEFIGEWMEKRGIRNQMVIATKYSSFYKRREIDNMQGANYVGNNVKSMTISVEDSLKKLRTHYIDILYVHWWDYVTSVEEVMNGLHNFVAAGKVLYLGASNMPAWVVAKANQYAKLTGKTPFSIYQGSWNILARDLEREIIPMARDEGLAIAPWNVLCGGKIRTDEEEETRRRTGENGRTSFDPNWERNPNERKICKALEEVAKQVGTKSIQAVAIAYLMHKTPYVFPVVGGRKVEHLHSNMEALNIALSEEQIQYLEGVLPFDVGFPSNFIGDGSKTSPLTMVAAHFDSWPRPSVIRPVTDKL